MGFTKNGLHLTCFLFIQAILPHILHDIDRLGFTPAASCIRGRPSVILFGWDDFKPFHGSGSGESKAFQEEQWQFQQDKIRERSNEGLTKDKLKKKYQNKGIESALIRNLQLEVMPRNTIKGVELAWVGDFNTKMLAIHEATGAARDKVHRTYQFTFSSQT